MRLTNSLLSATIPLSMDALKYGDRWAANLTSVTGGLSCFKMTENISTLSFRVVVREAIISLNLWYLDFIWRFSVQFQTRTKSSALIPGQKKKKEFAIYNSGWLYWYIIMINETRRSLIALTNTDTSYRVKNKKYKNLFCR